MFNQLSVKHSIISAKQLLLNPTLGKSSLKCMEPSLWERFHSLGFGVWPSKCRASPRCQGHWAWHEGWLMGLVPWLECMAQGRGNREREYTENDPVYFTSWDHPDFILPILQMAELDVERWSLLSKVPWTLDGRDYDDPSATPPYSAETFYSFDVCICPFPKWKSKHLLSRYEDRGHRF